jgi:peptide chain release factor 3
MEPAPYETARWLDADDPVELKRFLDSNRSTSAEDHDGAPVFLARNAWELRQTMKEWPQIRFTETREQA